MLRCIQSSEPAFRLCTAQHTPSIVLATAFRIVWSPHTAAWHLCPIVRMRTRECEHERGNTGASDTAPTEIVQL